MSFPEIYQADQTTPESDPVGGLSITAGTLSGERINWIYNDKSGTHSATNLVGAYLRAQAWNGEDWLNSGEPEVDEGHLEVQVTGVIDNVADSSMEPQQTGWVALSANRALFMRSIPPGCGRQIKSRIRVPGGTPNLGHEAQIALVYNATAFSLGSRASLATGRGVIPARYDASLRAVTEGLRVSASGANAFVTSGRYVFDGTPYFKYANENVALNQTAADGALSAGEAYVAVISLAAGATSLTATKGNKAAAPTAPATPTDHIHIGQVNVAYQGGGTTILSASDISQTRMPTAEFALVAGTGLNVSVGCGEAITTSDVLIVHTSSQIVAVTDNATNYIWLLRDGTFTHNTTNGRPDPDAMRIGRAVAAGGVITSTSAGVPSGSHREMTGHALTEFCRELRYFGQLAAADELDWFVLGEDAELIGYRVDVGAPGVQLPGSTVATFRIKFATNPTTLTWTNINAGSGFQIGVTHGSYFGDYYYGGGADSLIFLRGTRFTFDILTTSGTPPKDCIVTLYFRKL